ncbi:MAG: winged helix-turn-helix domain-containing protein [Bacteroidota bacterium]
MTFSALIPNSSILAQDSKKLIKIALREGANQVLLSKQDSTTLISPVRALSDSLFEISFNAKLSFEPDALVNNLESSLKKSGINSSYTVEVKRCDNREVVYSYLMTNSEDSTSIPCSGRAVPRACYLIEVGFTGLENRREAESPAFYRYMFIGLFLAIILLSLAIYLRRPKTNYGVDPSAKVIGKFKFYPEQLKLIKEAQEIALSKKECEILELLLANLNDIVTREELSKRIWEDQGVIVGRSLDTYISKLRKKLKDDDNINISNIHGVGYKLELKQ